MTTSATKVQYKVETKKNGVWSEVWPYDTREAAQRKCDRLKGLVDATRITEITV